MMSIIAVTVPNLSSEEQQAVLVELRNRYPDQSDATLLSYIQGVKPVFTTGTRTEQEGNGQAQALANCTAMADKIYHEAVSAAGAIGNNIARAIALAVAFAAWAMTTVECYSENS